MTLPKYRKAFTLAKFNVLPSVLLEGRYKNIPYEEAYVLVRLVWWRRLAMFCCIAPSTLVSVTLLFLQFCKASLEERMSTIQVICWQTSVHQ